MNRNDAKLFPIVKGLSGSLHRIAWLVGLVAIGVSAESARAQVVAFTDNFERPTGNTVGNGWVETEQMQGNASLANDGVTTYCSLTRNGTVVTQSGIDTTGQTNITFDYDWRDNGATEATDSLIVEWKPSADGTFITLATHSLVQATFMSESHALPATAENTSIDIRFTVAVNQVSEGAHVDNVEVCAATSQAGACCVDIDDGPCAFDTCFETTQDDCDTQGGVFHGAGTACMVLAGCSPHCGNLDPFCCALNNEGCPNASDSDGDGVLDCNDVCPGFDDNLDADGDGTPDGCDGCPNDPNKTDPSVCGCGVPDIDSDGDGFVDCIDNCPTDPNKSQPGICGCGVSDVDDTDGDGTSDCDDLCPNDPNKTDPGCCGCGVPDSDNDGDGFPDCLQGGCGDGCPNDPNKTDPGACGCGVPDVDSDGDGLFDCLDLCPGDPNNDLDADGVCGDIDNCPDDPNSTQGDKDGDTVGDACDNCPNTPNLDQTDSNGDDVGDACDDEDGDGVPDSEDVCPFTPPGMMVDAEGRPKGDMNDDCVVDGLDVSLFVEQALNQQ